MLAAVALALILVQRGYGGIAVSVLMLAAAVPPILLAPIAGRVVDRLDSRMLLVVVGCLQVAFCVALAYVTSIYAIVALVALLAAGMAFTSPTFGALTPAMVDREDLPKASALMQTYGMIGSLAAPVLGGLLVGQFGSRVPLLVDAATCLAVPLAGLLLRTRRRGGVANSSQPAPVVAPDPSWSILRDPLVRPVALLMAAVVGTLTAVNVVDVFYVRETLDASATFYGIVSALWVGGMLIGTTIVGRLKPDDARYARLMLMFLAGTGLTVLLVGLVPHAIWLVPLEIVGGITNGGENVIGGVLLGRRAPAATRGHAFAMFGGMMNVAVTVGLLGGGLLLSVAAPRAIVFGAGMASLLVIIPFIQPMRAAIRRERAATTITEDARLPLLASSCGVSRE